MISAAGIKVYSYLNITAVADFFMEIKPGEHGRVTLRGYLAGMPDVGRLQEEAVRITLQEDGDNCAGVPDERRRHTFRCGQRKTSGHGEGADSLPCTGDFP